jgi:hypothetical protein
MVDVEVSVDQSVSHRDDRRLMDRRRGGPHLGAQFGRRFANDFDRPDERDTQHQIGVEIVAPPPVPKTAGGLGGLDHMADSKGVVRPHTELRLSVRPPRGNGGSDRAECASPPSAHSATATIRARSPQARSGLALLAAQIRPGGRCRSRAEPRLSTLSRTATIAECGSAGKETPTPPGRGTRTLHILALERFPAEHFRRSRRGRQGQSGGGS